MPFIKILSEGLADTNDLEKYCQTTDGEKIKISDGDLHGFWFVWVGEMGTKRYVDKDRIFFEFGDPHEITQEHYEILKNKQK